MSKGLNEAGMPSKCRPGHEALRQFSLGFLVCIHSHVFTWGGWCQSSVSRCNLKLIPCNRTNPLYASLGWDYHWGLWAIARTGTFSVIASRNITFSSAEVKYTIKENSLDKHRKWQGKSCGTIFNLECRNIDKPCMALWGTTQLDALFDWSSWVLCQTAPLFSLIYPQDQMHTCNCRNWDIPFQHHS